MFFRFLNLVRWQPRSTSSGGCKFRDPYPFLWHISMLISSREGRVLLLKYCYFNHKKYLSKLYKSKTSNQPHTAAHSLDSLSLSKWIVSIRLNPLAKLNEASRSNTQVKCPKTYCDQEMMPSGNPLVEQ